jgi:hypothetical protein
VEEKNETDRNLETTDVPTKEEVTVAVNNLKNSKTPAPDGVPSKILKYINLWRIESMS